MHIKRKVPRVMTPGIFFILLPSAGKKLGKKSNEI
jgi:hypothetical protein